MAPTAPSIITRLKREECKRTKHDPEFSKWKILVGPSDWEDYKLGKEGAERYRSHNLPNFHGPGVYELGICVRHTSLGRDAGKLDPADIVVVYLGQAENVRTRLQHYGRSGAHLANVDSGLFEGIFTKGYSIVFRLAPMKSKRDAEKTEAQLLDTFDYAWNKGSNGARRRSDVLQKLEKASSSNPLFPNITRRLQMLGQRQAGVRIKASKPFFQENGLGANQDNYSLLSQVFKFGRSQPRLVSERVGVIGNNNSICGVALGDGSICERPPVEGRKRCVEHKGMKPKGSISKLIEERKLQMGDLNQDSGFTSHNKSNHNYTSKCGVTLADGSFCKRPPVQGNKRCWQHKGMRTDTKINCEGSISKLIEERKSQMGDLNQDSGFTSHNESNHNYTSKCGVTLADGSFCKRPPVQGNKRCWQHKGMRTDTRINCEGSISKLIEERKSQMGDLNQDSGFTSHYESNHNYTSKCGVTLADGSFCKRPPVQGNKRCWQHKGMRTDMRISCSFSMLESETSVCGIFLQDGSVCSRAPVGGRKRCEQHKWMKLTARHH